MKPAIVYHWWGEPSDPEPIKNLRAPILLSIATLRGSDPNIPIYVLDGSPGQYYGDYPRRMNFTVVPLEFELIRYDYCPGWKHMSRIFDLRRFADTIEEDTIIYCDTDVFWKESPLPLLGNLDKFCFNQYNTGYFYFKKDAPQSNRFFEIFESYTITALNDDNFRYISRQHVGYNDWYYVFDEAILGYMYNKHRDLFSIIDLREHCTTSSMFPDGIVENLDPGGIRMVHANGIQVFNEITNTVHSRGLVPLVVKEFYDKLRMILDLNEVYSAEEVAVYLPLQISLWEEGFMKSLLKNRTSKGLYDLMYALKEHKQNLKSCQ